jgi:hypothetical protein
VRAGSANVEDKCAVDYMGVRGNDTIGRRVCAVVELGPEANRDRSGLALDVVRIIRVHAISVAVEDTQRAEIDLDRFAEVCDDAFGLLVHNLVESWCRVQKNRMSLRRASKGKHAHDREQRDTGEPAHRMRTRRGARGDHCYSTFNSISSRIMGSNDAWLGWAASTPTV